jgi:hypothetical protein
MGKCENYGWETSTAGFETSATSDVDAAQLWVRSVSRDEWIRPDQRKVRFRTVWSAADEKIDECISTNLRSLILVVLRVGEKRNENCGSRRRGYVARFEFHRQNRYSKFQIQVDRFGNRHFGKRRHWLSIEQPERERHTIVLCLSMLSKLLCATDSGPLLCATSGKNSPSYPPRVLPFRPTPEYVPKPLY